MERKAQSFNVLNCIRSNVLNCIRSIRPRKRKVRDERGRWVDPKDLEGRVIEHGAKVEEGNICHSLWLFHSLHFLTQPYSLTAKSRPKRTIRRPKHLDDDFRNGYDPFRLVPLEQYDQQPPFHVTIVSDALVCGIKLTILCNFAT